MSAKAAVEKHIAENHVVVFSKSYCPYCRRTKGHLADLNESPVVFELDEMDEGSDWQAYLGQKTGQTSVPSIWIDGTFVGGNSDLEAKLKTGEVQKLLGKGGKI
ncbi:glutaredoxin [Pseudohyphozyma bogoriensis]|nr:glutaredoxin [Pseudohyphozyma bogoriensis]